MPVKPHLLISLISLSVFSFSCGKKEEAPAPTPNENKEAITSDPTGDALSQRRVAPQEVETEDTLPEAQLYIKPTRSPEQFLANFIELLQSDVSPDQIQHMLEDYSNLKLSAEQVEQIKALQSLVQSSKADTPATKQLEKVGDIKINQVSRWALKHLGQAPILIDVSRQGSSAWSIEQIAIPQVASNTPAPSTITAGDEATTQDSKGTEKSAQDDPLNFSYFFLQALLKQDFRLAKTMVDTNTITDATLAALCIIFDEAAYTIDKKKPLRALFMRETAAGFYANVISSEGSKAAHFSILTQRETAQDKWKIYEINLNDLLSDFTKRMGAGDSYFTPLVKNPQGGDTLVIYFDFDSDQITPRMEKQLQIVTALLKLDNAKKITLSGHTDSKGQSGYNLSLSEKRALKVKEYLSSHGVNAAQIITKSLGATIPRAPNTFNDGSDNPDGRRANRRTEIFLDF
ncbi:OmpA family protein [Rubritalea marina]|uniref:OmpA family protein n=1 Tax=Rubritalea marina TaxID=361055 RepID=UPI0003A54FA3|nr:OmpA family protein [Rubritalea marina]